MFGKRMIVLNSYSVAKEALVSKAEVFAGKPTFDPLTKLFGGYGTPPFVPALFGKILTIQFYGG